MKRWMMVMAIISLLFLTGCGVYGDGKTYGYVTTVEDGIFWDRVWLRAELESSQTDCYIIKDENLKSQLENIAEMKIRIEMQFKRHIFAMTMCENYDEVTGYDVIENQVVIQ